MNDINFKIYALNEYLSRKYAPDFQKHARWMKKMIKKEKLDINIDEWNIVVRPETILIKKDFKEIINQSPPKE